MVVCLLSFFHFDDKTRDKHGINYLERVRNEAFLQHVYDVTVDVILQRSIWIISYQHENVPTIWCFPVPAGTRLKLD